MIEALKEYQPSCDEEFSAKDRMLSFLETDEVHYDRANQNRHFTASGLVVDPSKNKVLLNHHKFLDLWLCFGGHADGCSDLTEVAYRETIEESGLAEDKVVPLSSDIFDIDIHAIPERKDRNEPPHEHYDVLYLFKASADTPLEISEESLGLRWCDIDAAKRLSSADGRMQRILQKYEMITFEKAA